MTDDANKNPIMEGYVSPFEGQVLGKDGLPAPTDPVDYEIMQFMFENVMQMLYALSRRIRKLEESGGQLAYRGIFQRAIAYAKGHAVTHDGSCWIALRDTVAGEAPGGKGDGPWQLAVKRGADAK